MPLTLGYSSSYGVLADAYHVLTDFFVTSGSANDTIVSGSLWVNKSAFDNNKTPIIKYTFDFNSLKGTPGDGGKTPAVMQPDIYSQSYAALKQINVGGAKTNPNNFVDSDGNTPMFDFRNATED